MTDTTDASRTTDAAGTADAGTAADAAAVTAASSVTAAAAVSAVTDTAGASGTAGAPSIPRPPRPGDASRATELAALFPALHAPQYWAWGRYDAQFSTVLPPDELVTNIHLVGFTGDDRVVLCRDDRNHWFLPGGTREHNESVDSCLVRELREEAGARLLGAPVWLGAHRCVTDDPVPYRPWQPHPEKAWLWGWADVAVDSVPTNPDDGEQVVEVRAVEPDEARRLLLGGHEAWWGELIALAVELRSRPR